MSFGFIDMLSKIQFYVLCGLGGFALVMCIVSSTLILLNHAERNEYAERAQFIQNTVQLEAINTKLIRSAAEASARQNDAQLRDLLASQGISFKVNSSEHGK